MNYSLDDMIYIGFIVWLAYMFMFGVRNFTVRVICMFTTRSINQSGLGAFLDLCAFLYIIVIIQNWGMILTALGGS